MTEVTIHLFETVMTRHGYIQAGSQVSLPEAEAERLIELGCAREIMTPEGGRLLAEYTEADRRRRNPAKMARAAAD